MFLSRMGLQGRLSSPTLLPCGSLSLMKKLLTCGSLLSLMKKPAKNPPMRSRLGFFATSFILLWATHGMAMPTQKLLWGTSRCRVSLPVYSPYIPPVYSPYILGSDFAKQELKEEVVRLGVELSLHVAGSMFYLCDDIRSMLRFCYKFLEDARKDLAPDSPVMKSLLGVIHYVNSKYIKPKNGVCQNSGQSVQSVQWRLIWTTLESFGTGIRDLDLLVSILRSGVSYLDAREYTSSIEAALKEVDETLRCAKDVLEANGFARDAMESKILDLWKPLFDKETEESWSLSAMRLGIFSDLFHPLVEEKSSKT
ncbi:unnamed protein product [Arabidopsis halleri]